MKLVVSGVLLLLIGASYYLIQLRLQPEERALTALDMDIADEPVALNRLQNIDQYSAINERPLFVEARKFEEEKKVEAKPKVVRIRQDLKVQALGIAVSGEGIMAVVKNQRNGQVSRLKVGDEIEGWTLKSVSNQQFTFSKDGLNKNIKFKQ